MKKICKDIFTELNSKMISYCHFKSNTYLEAGLEGEADLDVLVKKEDYNRFTNIITKAGFKEFEPNEFCKYPGVTNWYGLDEETGTIIHIHLHTQLITGKSLIKDYIIPWDMAVLNYSHLSESGIKIDDSEIELLLLFTRMVVKRNIGQGIKDNTRRTVFPEDEWSEVIDLRKKIHVEKFKKICCELLGDNNYLKYYKMILEEAPVSQSNFSEFERFIKEKMKDNRRMSGVKAEVCSIIYRVRRKIFTFLNARFNTDYPIKKRRINKGAIFAFVGIDGSGKSTMIKEIFDWLDDEFDVKKYYLGAGQENASVIARGLLCIYQLAIKKREGISSTSSNMTRLNVSHMSLKDLIKAYFASFAYLMIAKSNLKSLTKALKFSNSGGMALCDRIPQTTMEVVHDGMKVQRYYRAYSKSPIISYMAKKEREIFERFDNILSNLYIIRMNINPELSYKRKKENERNSDERRKKAYSLKRIGFNNALKVFEIDCNNDFQDVLLDIKKVVWGAL